MCAYVYTFVCVFKGLHCPKLFEAKKHYKHLEVERPKGKNTAHAHIDILFSVKQSEHLFQNGLKKSFGNMNSGQLLLS